VHALTLGAGQRRSIDASLAVNKMQAMDPVIVTNEELLAEAEKLSRHVWKVSYDEAWKRLDAGELRGTIFASKMASIRFLLDAGNSAPVAAE